LRQLRGLLRGRKETVLECLLRYHLTILHPISAACNHLLIVGEAPTMRNSSPSKSSAMDGVFFRGFDNHEEMKNTKISFVLPSCSSFLRGYFHLYSRRRKEICLTSCYLLAALIFTGKFNSPNSS
jgi:hypothetical protein